MLQGPLSRPPAELRLTGSPVEVVLDQLCELHRIAGSNELLGETLHRVGNAPDVKGYDWRSRRPSPFTTNTIRSGGRRSSSLRSPDDLGRKPGTSERDDGGDEQRR